NPIYTGVDWGQNLWCISLIVLGISSLMGSINYITTVVNMRAPGMTWFRLPLTIWALFITAVLLLLSLPVLTSALGMLLFDRMASHRPWGGPLFPPPGGGGRAPPLPPLLLFLRPPRVLHPPPPRHGHRLRRALGLLAEADLRLPRDGLLHHGHRVPLLDRVGTPHVPERHEPGPRHELHDVDDGHRRALGHQDLQLAGHALAREHPPHHSDAVRHRLRVDVRDRRPVRHLHGVDAGRHLHPRHLLHPR